MVVFPNAKINLGLRVLRKRDDGFHDLESVFYPIALKDVLEIAAANETTQTSLKNTGIEVNGSLHDNLCYKAWEILKKDFPSLPPVQVFLHKAIPAGAGLGGGSADGSFTLKLLNNIFQLGLDEERLLAYALQLGSDCPFFIINSPCVAKGRGEKLERISLDLSGYRIVVINPGIHINTGKAFSVLTPALPAISTKDIISKPVTAWKNELINDFEYPVFKLYPEIEEIKVQLYNRGAVYASMTGTGSTVYGIFEKNIQPELSLRPSWFIHWSIGK